MKLSADAARQHVDYTIWATRRLLDAAATLSPEQLQRDFGTADRSILGTLQHVLRAEYGWLNRVQGNSQAPALPATETLSDLRTNWSAVHANWSIFVAGLSDADLESVCAYHDLKGNPWTNTLWEILLHVVNHSTHHRGQVSGFLRASGVTPPILDYIAYVRMRGA